MISGLVWQGDSPARDDWAGQATAVSIFQLTSRSMIFPGAMQCTISEVWERQVVAEQEVDISSDKKFSPAFVGESNALDTTWAHGVELVDRIGLLWLRDTYLLIISSIVSLA